MCHASRLVAFALAAIACISASASAQPRQASRTAPVFRHADVDAAWAAAQKSQRPVLVYVSASNCHFCKKMVSETLSHPQIQRANNRWFETAVVSNDTQPELVAKLGVKAFPTTLLVRPDGKMAARLTGYASPEKFVAKFYESEKPAARQADGGAPRRR